MAGDDRIYTRRSSYVGFLLIYGQICARFCAPVDYIIFDVPILHATGKFEIKLNIRIFLGSDGRLAARASSSNGETLQMEYTFLFTLAENNRINTPFKPKAKYSEFEHIMLLC